MSNAAQPFLEPTALRASAVWLKSRPLGRYWVEEPRAAYKALFARPELTKGDKAHIQHSICFLDGHLNRQP